jgi:glucan biosynthesis protein C
MINEPKKRPNRRYDLDWLKVGAVLLLFPYHTAMIFVLWPFHIKNPTLSLGLTVFNAFLQTWHMPLFFFLAGAATWYALGYRSRREYIGERFFRLGIPLAFGILVIIPPQVYVERLYQQHFSGTFFQFYPSIFTTGFYPPGNLSWNHLWFIAYLIVFSLLALPLFLRLKGGTGKDLMFRLTSYLAQGHRIFLLALPLMLIQALLRIHWPQGKMNLINDWANFFFYLTLLVYGFVLCSNDHLRETVVRNRYIALLFGVICFLFFLATKDITGSEPWLRYNAGDMAIVALHGFNTWCWLLVIIGLGISYLNFTNRLLSYASEAAYPFYILHQTIILVFGFYVLSFDWSITAKFTFIILLSFSLILLIYELLVRRIKPLRFLLGIRKSNREGTR